MKKSFLRKIIISISVLAIFAQSISPYLVLLPQSAYAQEVTQTDSITEAPIIDQSVQAPTDAITPVPTDIPAPTEIITPTPTNSPTDTITPTPAQVENLSPPADSSLISAEPSATLTTPSKWTFENVELNKEYIAPQNNAVKLTFTKLPSPSGNIKIEEVTLTKEQIEQSGSLSDKAYDITSDMKDGDFTYNLSLPLPESAKGKTVEVRFAEELSNIGTAEKVENTLTKTDTSVSVKSLDHFTIFVVSGLTASDTMILVDSLQPNWDAGVFSAYVGPPAYGYVSPGTTAVYSGREAGIIKAGFNTSPADDEGLFAFIPNVTIDTFAAGTLTYDVVNQTGVNPVWMTIEIDTGVVGTRADNTVYQFVPTPNPAGWNTFNAGSGLWLQWTTYTSGITVGSPMTLSAIVAANTGLNVVRTYLRLGMGESYYNGGTGTTAWVDKVTLGGVTYDFVVADGVTPTSCTGASITPPVGTTACYSTIQAAVNAATSGETINVAPGTYTEVGQIVINKNLSIVGADKATTIIKPAQDTSGDGDAGSWILVNDGITLDLSKVTLDGIGKQIRQGIRFNGSGTVNDVIIQNIVKTGYMGFAIVQGYANTGSRTLSVTNSTFTNFGRVGIQADNGSGSSTVTISNNNFTGKGNGDHLDYAITVEGGAVATITNNTISNCRGVASTDGSTSAGISATTYFAGGTEATITGNTLHNNTTGISVGYDSTDTTVVTAHNNKIYNNSDTGISTTSNTVVVNATSNWWGNASGPYDNKVLPGTPNYNNPSGTGNSVTSYVDYKPWFTDLAMTTLSLANPITEAATGITLTNATLNGVNGDYNASNTSFWWGTTSGGPFNACTSCDSQLPVGWTHDTGLGAKTAGSSISENLTGLTPGTPYYFVVWSQVAGTWYPGNVLSFTTDSPDTTAPAVPTLVSPASGTYVKPAGLILNWSDVTDPQGSNPVTYYYQSSYSSTVGSNNALISPIYTSGALTTSQIDASGSSDHLYYWQVKACDNLGNCSNWSGPWAVNIDGTLPTVPVNGTPHGVVIPMNNFDFNWDDSDDNSPITYLFHSSLNPASTSGVLTTGLWNSGVLPSSMIHSSGAGDGVWYWQVRAIDVAGNASAWSDIWNVKIDTNPPVAPTLIAPANNSIVTGASLTNSWSSVTDATKYIYESYNDSGATSLRWHQEIAAPITSKTATGVVDTTFWWKVKAIDAAGNESLWSNLWKVTVDNIAPVVHITAPNDGDILRGNVVISGTITDINPHHYYLVVKNSANEVVAGPGTVNAANVSDYNWNTTVVADGIYTIDLQARDAAGNKDSSSTEVIQVTVDNSAPSAPTITSPTDGQYFASTPITAHWTSVSDNPSGVFKYQVGYVYDDHHLFSGSTCSDLPNGGCRDVAGNITSRNHMPSTGEQGGVTIYVRAIDGAGNVGAWSDLTHYIYDATAPTVPVADPPAGDYSSDQDIALSSSDTGGSGISSIYYTLDGSTPNSTKTAYTGPINIDNDLVLKAIAYDNAGNTSAVLSAAYGIPPIITEEASSEVGLTVVTITWITNHDSTSRVVYGTIPVSNATVATFSDGSNYGYTNSTVEDPTKVTTHSVGLTGLVAGTTYYYRTISHGSPEATSDENSFTTTTSPTLSAVSGVGPGDGRSDGLSDGKSDGGSSGTAGSVLGISIEKVGARFPEIQNQTEELEKEVLGTESATTEFVPESKDEQSPAKAYVNSIFTSRTTMLLVFLFVAGFLYAMFRLFKRRRT